MYLFSAFGIASVTGFITGLLTALGILLYAYRTDIRRAVRERRLRPPPPKYELRVTPQVTTECKGSQTTLFYALTNPGEDYHYKPVYKVDRSTSPITFELAPGVDRSVSPITYEPAPKVDRSVSPIFGSQLTGIFNDNFDQELLLQETFYDIDLNV